MNVGQHYPGNELTQHLLGLLHAQEKLLDQSPNQTNLYLYELRADRIFAMLSQISTDSPSRNSGLTCKEKSRLSVFWQNLTHWQFWPRLGPRISKSLRFVGNSLSTVRGKLKKQRFPELHNQRNSW